MVFSITQIVVAPIVAGLLLNRYMNTLGNKKAELFDMGGGVGEPTAEEKEMHLKNSGFLLLFWFSAALVCCGGAGLPSGSEQYSVMAIVTCLVGLHYGHIIVHFKDHRVRMLYWMIPSSYLVVCGLTLDLFGMHINKVLYSFSYTCVTAGAAGILFVGTYLMGLKDIIAETLSSGLDRSTSDAIMPDGIDKLEQQRRPLLSLSPMYSITREISYKNQDLMVVAVSFHILLTALSAYIISIRKRLDLAAAGLLQLGLDDKDDCLFYSCSFFLCLSIVIQT
ncbi:hypothetical protein RIF29_40982 [Crotalaria pallida]|uniref:Uncharacterized protein n=1 Tax=Crotalaria pallida TaxID=3830 RepID=A0AAN9HUT4_CROPI